MKRQGDLFGRFASLENLHAAAASARRGKRYRADVAAFQHNLESELLALQCELADGTWQPAGYRQFVVREPKRRLISAAPYRDRVVHHAICRIIEPLFEPSFIDDSYACRRGKGTHRALARCHRFVRTHRYVLKGDVSRFFPSLDHELLLAMLARRIKDRVLMRVIEQIVDSSPRETAAPAYFPGDDLFTPLQRVHGIPIGNLTSQFFANLYLNGLDHTVKRALRVRAYLRYCDDFLLFDNDKARLHDARAAIEEYLLGLRLRLHPRKTRVQRCADGVAFVGFRVFPTYRRLTRDGVIRFRRRLRGLVRRYAAGEIGLEEVAPRVRAWLAHAAHGDTWRLREQILGDTVFQRREQPRGRT